LQYVFSGKLRTRLLCGEAEMQVAFDMLNLRAVGVSMDMDCFVALFDAEHDSDSDTQAADMVLVRKCRYRTSTCDTLSLSEVKRVEHSPWHGMSRVAAHLASALAGNDITLFHLRGFGNVTSAKLVRTIPATDSWSMASHLVETLKEQLPVAVVPDVFVHCVRHGCATTA
jgi:hypothetical protein